MSHKPDQHHCVNFNKSASVEQCGNTDSQPVVVPGGETRTISVPVTLAQREVNSHLVANIHFPDPVLEIKDIKKRVEIVQCRLMTETRTNGAFSAAGATYPLFLKGWVRKNIQYASPCHDSDGQCVSSEIKSLTTRIPFECMTSITLDAPVQLPETNNRSEFDFFRAQDLGKGFPEKDKFLSSDLSQFHQSSTQFYNRLPFCEIVSSKIIEWDEATDRKLFGDNPDSEGYFSHMIEKMNLRFTVRVLQEQLITVDTAFAPTDSPDDF
ncbi:DUF3794 domain-containing protein [Bacillus sp. AFS015802]|uniref:CsxC family protein n=1 Tax=Bacillus sp. AFS015802 TaxID=2033486 RepID=UPI000BF7DCFD|nr:DUF3794 domain-containing protein [Bacillus sp. AFS015802]PFA67801.1 DUF3794 domain-containing protein [Bacillus sp. AFS015802]